MERALLYLYARWGDVGTLRSVTGRHRGQPKVADEEGDERSSRKWIGVVAGAFLVPVVLCSAVAFGLREEPAPERPGTLPVTPVATEPTYGQFVPPGEGPEAGTKAPDRVAPPPVVTPQKKRRATPRPSPSATWQPCPPGWRGDWWMYRWCWRQRGNRGR